MCSVSVKAANKSWPQVFSKILVLKPNFQGRANARFAPLANALSLDATRVQICLLEFSVKAHPNIIVILFAFTCSEKMFASKITTELKKIILNFMCARIAALSLFQANFDKS